MGSKPTAAVGERISNDGRHDLGSAARFSTTTSSLQGRAGGSAFRPKLVELVFGPGSTRVAEQLSPCIALTAVAASSVHSRVFMFACPSASMARRGCRASYSRRIKRKFILLRFSVYSCVLSNLLLQTSRTTQTILHTSGLIRPEFFLLGDRAIALKDSLVLLPWHVRVTSTSRN